MGTSLNRSLSSRWTMGSDKKNDPVGRRLGLKGVHLVDVFFLQRDLFFFNELIMIIYI
jgi:hypothetical protein